MKSRVMTAALFICVVSATVQADSALPNKTSTIPGGVSVQGEAAGESSAGLARFRAAAVMQPKPATVAAQPGEAFADGNTLWLVLLASVVMGSIALRRTWSAR
jgi:hypothetical protein